jgi:hypothetical protein
LPVAREPAASSLLSRNQGVLSNGNEGNDVVDGGEGNDDLSGATQSGFREPGNDRLIGGPGSDNVVDCNGHNQLDGSPDTDLCQFDATQSTCP